MNHRELKSEEVRIGTQYTTSNRFWKFVILDVGEKLVIIQDYHEPLRVMDLNRQFFEEGRYLSD